MSVPPGSSEAEFDRSCDQQQNTPVNLLARRMYEALKGCGVFEVDYVFHDTRHVARFCAGDEEICRAVVGTGEYDGRTYRGIWIGKARRGSNNDWPSSRSLLFQDQFGFEARAGQAVIDWCLEHLDRVNELLVWFVSQAVGDERTAEIEISVDTDSVIPRQS